MTNQTEQAGKKAAKKRVAKGLTPEDLDAYLEDVIDNLISAKSRKQRVEWARVFFRQTTEVIDSLLCDEDCDEDWDDAMDELNESHELKMLAEALYLMDVDLDEAHKWCEKERERIQSES